MRGNSEEIDCYGPMYLICFDKIHSKIKTTIYCMSNGINNIS